ncbi:MAG TPA: sensor domain-containing diguanylate cyclase [Candidatus Dormibacteraeota bacterium]|nr:sensor domain-containing diguanylate cyclase [Candidatus Dormibacteraeota bacterium]
MPGTPLQEIATALLGDLDGLTAEMVEGYRGRIPEYPQFLERHQEDVSAVSRGALGVFLKLIAEGRDPTDRELLAVRAFGRERAAQGLPLDSMLQAYSIGREIAWEHLTTAAENEGASAEEIEKAAELMTRFMEKVALMVTQGFLDHLRQAYEGEHHRMEVLVEIAKAMSRSLDMDDVVGVGLEQLRDALEVEWAGLWLVSVEKGLLRFLSQRSRRHHDWSAIGKAFPEVALDQPFLGPAARGASPVPYVATNLPEPVAQVGAKMLVIVPLLHRERPLGAIAVAGTRDELVPRDREFLVAIAEQMAVAVHQVQEHMREARTDFLTGLANRHEFDSFLRRELARAERFGDSLSLAMIDLDDLKMLNDRDGHQAGDEALRTVGATLKATVRSLDLAARIGGDEFALVMPQTDARGAGDVVTRFQQHLADARRQRHLEVQVSVGIAEWREGMTLDTLAAAADSQLYGDKRSREATGQNQEAQT